MEEQRKAELARIATKIRLGAVTAVYSAAAGHPGGSLSIADILAYLYFEKMQIDPKRPAMQERDRLVLSKGHTSPALYAALALRGYFPEEDLKTFRQVDSYLQGHPDMKHIPGVDMSSGSLGLGLSAACGMALAGKLDHAPYRVYAICGDGESEEGQIWEAAMFAAHYQLQNLTLFLDYNGLQIDGPVAEVIGPAPFEEKFAAFGWHVLSICGHDFDQIEAAVQEAERVSDRPTVIVAKTIKGKGVSYMENACGWHGKAPNEEQYQIAVAELTARLGGKDNG